MDDETDRGLAIGLASLATLGAAAALVGVRSAVGPAVIALTLASVVVVCGWIGGRAGGLSAAVMAAVGFDFFHTEPYLSLKISETDDILATILLLFVGVAVGTIASWSAAARRRTSAMRVDAGALTRVLAVAAKGCSEDVELSVRAELIALLHLQDCWFTSDATQLPQVGPFGELDLPVLRYRPGGFELPEAGIVIPVVNHGRTLGGLVCIPLPATGVSVEQRHVAVVLAGILGLAMGADPPAAA